jgi:hypothetical protein
MNVIQEILDELDVKEYVTDTAKENILKWLSETFLPRAKDFIKKYKEELKVSSEKESGWCKFRDAVFLPLVFDAGMWLFETALNKTIEETTTKKE